MALLDSIASTVCFDLKKLRAAYAGSCLRVRRASDNLEANIGFGADGNFDWAGAAAFAGGSALTVVKVYDQSGGGRDFVAADDDSQATLDLTNKEIVSDGAFDGYSVNQIDLTGASAISLFCRFKKNSNVGTQTIAEFGANWNSVPGAFHLYTDGANLEGGAAGSGTYNYKSKAIDTAYRTASLIIDKSLAASDVTKLRVDGSSTGVNAPSSQNVGTTFGNLKLYLGCRADTNLRFNGAMRGFVLMQTAASDAQRDAIEAGLGVQNSSGGGGGDTTPPTGTISAPTANQTVSGNQNLQITAADNVQVASVQWKIDGNDFGAPVTVAPYSKALDTTALSNGAHAVSAVVSDTATPPNQTTAATVNFTVNNQSGGNTKKVRVRCGAAEGSPTGYKFRKTRNTEPPVVIDNGASREYFDTNVAEGDQLKYEAAAYKNSVSSAWSSDVQITFTNN